MYSLDCQPIRLPNACGYLTAIPPRCCHILSPSQVASWSRYKVDGHHRLRSLDARRRLCKTTGGKILCILRLCGALVPVVFNRRALSLWLLTAFKSKKNNEVLTLYSASATLHTKLEESSYICCLHPSR